MNNKSLSEINVSSPRNRSEIEYILTLLREKDNKLKDKTFVVTEEFHPDGGYRNNIRSLEFALRQTDQRNSAPFVLNYFTKTYYEHLLIGANVKGEYAIKVR